MKGKNNEWSQMAKYLAYRNSDEYYKKTNTKPVTKAISKTTNAGSKATTNAIFNRISNENTSNKEAKPVKLGPLALYRTKIAEKKLKELAKKEAKNIAKNIEKNIKAVIEGKSKLTSGKVKVTNPTLISNKITLYTAAEALQSTIESKSDNTVDADVDTLLKKYESKLPKPKDYIKELIDQSKDDKDY